MLFQKININDTVRYTIDIDDNNTKVSSNLVIV